MRRLKALIFPLYGLTAAVILGGCVLTVVPGRELRLGEIVDTKPSTEDLSIFDDALHACRRAQAGRLNRKIFLRPTHLGVSRCLKRRGWEAEECECWRKRNASF